MKKQRIKMKHKIKDTVFTILFKIPKYTLELYKSLNPKAKDITEADIKTITLKSILANGFYMIWGYL